MQIGGKSENKPGKIRSLQGGRSGEISFHARFGPIKYTEENPEVVYSLEIPRHVQKFSTPG